MAKVFYGVWRDGMEWPELHAMEKSARERAILMGKQNVGCRVYMMKMTAAGTVLFSAEPQFSGELCPPAEYAQ